MVKGEPLAFVLHDGAVVGDTRFRTGGLHVNANMLPRPERMVADGIMHAVPSCHPLLPRFVVVGVGQIIFAIVFVNPRSLVEIHQPFHGPHRAVQFHHIILQPSALTRAAPAVVDVSLSVVVHKHARVDEGIHSFDVALHGEVGSRFLARGHPDFPTSVPIGLAGK